MVAMYHFHIIYDPPCQNTVHHKDSSHTSMIMSHKLTAELKLQNI